MKVKKQKKGISLIVLIITIIVMIILASAIVISLNNTGIIDKARKAVDLSNESGIKEALEITVTLLKQEGKLNEENLKAELEKSFEEVEVTKDTDGSYTVGIKNIYFTIEDDKIIKGKYDKWDGTKSEPTSMTDNEIHIYKASELKWVQEEVAEGNSFEGYTIYLENNLDLGARESTGDTLDAKWKTDANKAVKWTPIGKTKQIALKANFEGNDHIIKGAYVEETTTASGIFGRCYSEIQNLSVKNSYIEGVAMTGGIVGALESGKLENCHNINTTVVLTYVEDDNNNARIGGVIGVSKVDITNCTNNGNVIAYGMGTEHSHSYCGGIVGYPSSITIDNCINNGKIVSDGNVIGGIAGGFYSVDCSGIIQNCVNNGNIVSQQDFSGGIIGMLTSNNIVQNCVNNGDVSGIRKVGGIAGAIGTSDASEETATISNCVNKGKITGDNRIGGIVGLMAVRSEGNTVEKCFNIGEVKGTSYIAGIVGICASDNSIVKLCYNKGKVTGETDMGSIVGNVLEDTTGNTFSKLYYLSSLNLGAINGVDMVDQNVTKTTKDISSFEEFKTWIAQFE